MAYSRGGAWGLSPPGSVKSMVLSGRRLLSLPFKRRKCLAPLSINSWQRPRVQGLGDNFIYAKILFFPNLSFVKGTESINSSDPPCKKVNVRFTTVPFKPLTVHCVQRSPCVNLYKIGRIAVNPDLPCVQCELNSTQCDQSRGLRVLLFVGHTTHKMEGHLKLRL